MPDVELLSEPELPVPELSVAELSLVGVASLLVAGWLFISRQPLSNRVRDTSSTGRVGRMGNSRDADRCR